MSYYDSKDSREYKSEDDCLEEDGRTFVFENDLHEADSCEKRGIDRLNLAKVERTDSFDEVEIQEQTILVTFDLPDGSLGEGEFKLGQTVEVLKQYIEVEYGIGMSQQTLFFEETMMMDPLSILDYTDGSDSEFYVRVEGEISNEFKK